MSSPSRLAALQVECSRLALEPSFGETGPSIAEAFGGGQIRVPSRRACHLYHPTNPVLAASGFGATDAEALADAIACYRGRRLRDETELRLARARGRIYCQCRDGMLDGEHSCGHCDGGEYDEVRCRECEAPLAASDIACTCGEADGWLCATCAADGGLHSTGCPTPPACACGHGAQVAHCPDCSSWRCAACVSDRECCREAARAVGVA